MMPQTTEQWIAWVIVAVGAFLLRGFFPNLKIPTIPTPAQPNTPAPVNPADETLLKKIIDEVLKRLKDELGPLLQAQPMMEAMPPKPSIETDLMAVVHKLLDERRSPAVTYSMPPMMHQAVPRDDLPPLANG